MMSNEEWERKMEFLLNQQARFDSEMYELKETQKAAQARTDEALERAAENISHLAGFMHEGFGLTMNLFKEISSQIKEITESQKLTHEQLRKLITRFDRHLSEDHPGLEN